MTRRLATVALGLLLGAFVGAGTAWAASHPAESRLSISAESTTVSGRPVEVRVSLRDERGRPVPGALIRLVVQVTFMGSDREEIVDEARTNGSGVARMLFAPTETGVTQVTARFDGASGRGAAEASMSFDVLRPVPARAVEPVGLGGPWARSYLILIPVAGVWLAYLVALVQAYKIRRIGPRSGSTRSGDRSAIPSS